MSLPASREDIRRAYVEAWEKARAGKLLSVNERRIADVIADHPEYQSILESGEAALETDFSPESGHVNPFLHMGFHIAIREQVALDRPPGIRRIFETLARAMGQLDAEHAMGERLAETLWEAQRAQRTPDDAAYFERLKAIAPGADLG
jgi:hypothetical protein